MFFSSVYVLFSSVTVRPVRLAAQLETVQRFRIPQSTMDSVILRHRVSFNTLPSDTAEFFQELLCQRRNVPFPLPQRGKVEPCPLGSAEELPEKCRIVRFQFFNLSIYCANLEY